MHPPKSVAKPTDMHISYSTFSDIHIQTHTDTYRHIHIHTYVNTDTYMQYRHDTDIYSQPEPEPEPIKFKLRQVGLECNVSGDTWSHCHSQGMARDFSKPES